MAAGHEMRVSDAEREAAAAELREHFASGRLNQDELDERLTAVFAAKTRGDLNALFTDLPSAGHGWARAGAPADGPAGRRSAGAGPVGAAGLIGPGARDAGGLAGARQRLAGLGRAQASAGSCSPAVLVWVLFIVGILGVFGIGTGRPIGIVLIFAAFALLRRLLFVIFGRGRRGGGGRGRGGRRRFWPPPLRALAPRTRYRQRPPGDKIAVRDLSWKGPNFRANGKCDGDALLRSLSRWRRRPRPATGTARAAHRGRGTRRCGGGPWRALRRRAADPRRAERTPRRGVRGEDVRPAHPDHGRPAGTGAAGLAHRPGTGAAPHAGLGPGGLPATRTSAWRAGRGPRRALPDGRPPGRGAAGDRRRPPTGRAGSPRFRCCSWPC